MLDHAKLDVMVLDLRLSRLEAGGGREGDGDRGTPFGEGGVAEPGRDDQRNDRERPDRREAPAVLLGLGGNI